MLGFATVPVINGKGKLIVDVPESQYQIYFLFSIAFASALMLNELLFKPRYSRRASVAQSVQRTFQQERLLLLASIFFVSATAWFIVLLFMTPELFSFSSRSDFVDSKPFLYSFYLISAIFSSVLLVLAKKYRWIVLPAGFVFFDLSLGSREFFALFLFSNVLAFMFNLGDLRLVRKLGYFVLGLFLLYFVLVYKYSYVHLHAGDYYEFFYRFINFEFVRKVFALSESAIVQGNLFLILEHNFSLSLSHLLPGLIFVTPIHRSWVGIELNPLGRKLESQVFGDLDYGIAGNLLGELYAIFGMFSIVILFLYFILFFWFINQLLSSRDIIFRVFGFVFSFYALFYIHRMEFYELAGMFRILVFVCLIPYLVYLFVWSFRKGGG
ncbi:hypothetical protein [Marinobacter sp. LN3S78]|uniref:hypothetical protein n=1 Tax=Marinobacter sp. LN3S78 TaxID=3382300 RepID=UPI00387B1BC6